MAKLQKSQKLAVLLAWVFCSILFLIVVWSWLPAPKKSSPFSLLSPLPAPSSTAATATSSRFLQTGEKAAPASSASGTASSILALIRIFPTGSVCDDQGFVCVATSSLASLGQNPFMVTGTVMGLMNPLTWQIEDASGVEIFGQKTDAIPSSSTGIGIFTLRAFWRSPMPASTGTLVISGVRASHEGGKSLVRIPVSWPALQAQSVKVYYSPTSIEEWLAKSASSAAEPWCKTMKAFSIKTAATPYIIEGTLRALLAADGSESPGGKFIPDRVELLSFSLQDGLARAVFDEGLVRDGLAPCRVAGIRAQIEQTLKRFSAVRSVEILVRDGASVKPFPSL